MCVRSFGPGLKQCGFGTARCCAVFETPRYFCLLLWTLSPNVMRIFVKPLDMSWFYEKPRGSATLGKPSVPGDTLDQWSWPIYDQNYGFCFIFIFIFISCFIFRAKSSDQTWNVPTVIFILVSKILLSKYSLTKLL